MNNTSFESSLTIQNGSAAQNDRTYHYVYASISFVGVWVNLLVIVVIARRNVIASRTTRLLLINQCSSDLICSLLNFTQWIVGLDIFVPSNILGSIICKVWYVGFIFWSVVLASVDSLILLTLERYLSTVHPHLRRRVFNKHGTYVYIAVSWLLGPVVESVSLTSVERNGNRCKMVTMNPDLYKCWGVVVLCAFFIVPLTLMFYCNIKMISVLRKRQAFHTSSIGEQAKRQLTYTAAAVGFSYLVLFAPNTISFFVSSITRAKIFDTTFYWLSRFLVTINFVVNPFVYALSLTTFRQQLQLILCSKRDHPPDDESDLRASSAPSSLTETGRV